MRLRNEGMEPRPRVRSRTRRLPSGRAQRSQMPLRSRVVKGLSEPKESVR